MSAFFKIKIKIKIKVNFIIPQGGTIQNTQYNQNTIRPNQTSNNIWNSSSADICTVQSFKVQQLKNIILTEDYPYLILITQSAQTRAWSRNKRRKVLSLQYKTEPTHNHQRSVYHHCSFRHRGLALAEYTRKQFNVLLILQHDDLCVKTL